MKLQWMEGRESNPAGQGKSNSHMACAASLLPGRQGAEKGPWASAGGVEEGAVGVAPGVRAGAVIHWNKAADVLKEPFVLSEVNFAKQKSKPGLFITLWVLVEHLKDVSRHW